MYTSAREGAKMLVMPEAACEMMHSSAVYLPNLIRTSIHHEYDSP